MNYSIEMLAQAEINPNLLKTDFGIKRPAQESLGRNLVRIEERRSPSRVGLKSKSSRNSQ